MVTLQGKRISRQTYTLTNTGTLLRTDGHTQRNTHRTGLFKGFQTDTGTIRLSVLQEERDKDRHTDTHTDRLRDESRTALRRDKDKDRLTRTRTSSQGQ